MTARTIPEHIQAAVKLAGRNARAVEEFGNTPAAVWFSFSVAIIAFPLFVMTMGLGDKQHGGIADLVSELGPYAVGWLLFPVVMARVVLTIDRERYYCRYIAAVNWCALIEYLAMSLLVVMRTQGILPDAFENILFVVLIVWVLTFQHFVARRALQVDGVVAALLVALRMVLDIAIVAGSGMLGG